MSLLLWFVGCLSSVFANEDLSVRIRQVQEPIIERERWIRAFTQPTPVDAGDFDRLMGLSPGKVRGFAWVSLDQIASLSQLPGGWATSPSRPIPRSGLRIRSFKYKWLEHTSNGDYELRTREQIVPLDFPELGALDVFKSHTFEGQAPFHVKHISNSVSIVAVLQDLTRPGGPMRVPSDQVVDPSQRIILSQFPLLEIRGERSPNPQAQPGSEFSWQILTRQNGNRVNTLSVTHGLEVYTLLDLLGPDLLLHPAGSQRLRVLSPLPNRDLLAVEPLEWRSQQRAGGQVQWSFPEFSSLISRTGDPVVLEGPIGARNPASLPLRMQWHLVGAFNTGAYAGNLSHRGATVPPERGATLTEPLQRAADSTFSVTISSRLRGTSEPFEIVGHQTAFFISNSGYAISAAHGFSDPRLEYQVDAPALIGMPGRLVLRASYSNDLAILQFIKNDGGAPDFRFPCTPAVNVLQTPEVGARVTTFGFPLPQVTLDPIRTSRQITGRPLFAVDGRQRLRGAAVLVSQPSDWGASQDRTFFASYPIFSGHSGGPLVNMAGEWIGSAMGMWSDDKSMFVGASALNNIGPQIESLPLRSGPAISSRSLEDIRNCRISESWRERPTQEPEWTFQSYDAFFAGALNYFDRWSSAQSLTPVRVGQLRNRLSAALGVGWLYPQDRIPGTWAASVPFAQVLDRWFQSELTALP